MEIFLFSFIALVTGYIVGFKDCQYTERKNRENGK